MRFRSVALVTPVLFPKCLVVVEIAAPFRGMNAHQDVVDLQATGVT